MAVDRPSIEFAGALVDGSWRTKAAAIGIELTIAALGAQAQCVTRRQRLGKTKVEVAVAIAVSIRILVRILACVHRRKTTRHGPTDPNQEIGPPGLTTQASRSARTAVGTDFNCGKSLGCAVAFAHEYLDHTAYRTAAINGRHVATHDFHSLNLIEHDVFQTHAAGAVLLGQRHTIDQHKNLQRGTAPQEQTGCRATTAILCELKASFARQQAW